jgi:hypothetical protein
MNLHDLLIEAIQRDIPKDFIIKIILLNKAVVAELNAKIRHQQEAILIQIRASYKYAKIGMENFDKDEELLSICEMQTTNLSLLSDTAEYTLKELSEIFNVHYKTCSKILTNKKVPHLRRVEKGKIYLGKTVKEYLAIKSKYDAK